VLNGLPGLIQGGIPGLTGGTPAASSGGASSSGASSGAASSGAASSGAASSPAAGVGLGSLGSLGSLGMNWFMMFFNPNSAMPMTDPTNNWLNVLMQGGSLLGGLTGGKMGTMADPNAGNTDPNAGNNDPDPDPSAGSTKQGVGAQCNGVSGTCLDSSVSTCSSSFLTGKCPGPTEVRCCPAGGVASNNGGSADPNQMVSAGSGSCSAYGGLVFPLATGSLSEISVNWGGSRNGGARCHAGIDIYTGGAKSVVAMSDGVVTAVLKNWYSCTGGSIDAILVYHDSGALSGMTANYGEVNPGSYSVGVGSRVTRGQKLATASACGMLHFELYSGRQTANQRWLPASGSVGSGCAGNSLSTKPAVLLDPRPVIRCTMPSGARFRGGVGFLNQGDLSAFDKDLQEEGSEHTALPVGGIIAIVVGFLVICLGVIGIAVYMRIRRARASGPGMSVPNAMYSADASTTEVPKDFGKFNCPQCGKQYDYGNDLDEHVKLRHA